MALGSAWPFGEGMYGGERCALGGCKDISCDRAFHCLLQPACQGERQERTCPATPRPAAAPRARRLPGQRRTGTPGPQPGPLCRLSRNLRARASVPPQRGVAAGSGRGGARWPPGPRGARGCAGLRGAARGPRARGVWWRGRSGDGRRGCATFMPAVHCHFRRQKPPHGFTGGPLCPTCHPSRLPTSYFPFSCALVCVSRPF